MSFSMRWEVFKARHSDANRAPRMVEPPHILRQHFALTSREVECDGSTFEVFSVAPMKFDGDDALAELSPAQAADKAVLYIATITKGGWDFVGQLTTAGLRVDVAAPVEALVRECFAQLSTEHGAQNVTVIGDAEGADLALIAGEPGASILNSPRRRADNPPLNSPNIHVWAGTLDPNFSEAQACAEQLGAQLHAVEGGVRLLHLTNTPEAKTAIREMIHITGAK